MNPNQDGPPFKIKRQQLINIIRLYQKRTQGIDQLQYIIDRGGISYLFQGGLQTDPIRGIQKSTFRKRSKQYGRNHIPSQTSPSFFKLLLEALSDFTLKILICAAITSIIIQQVLSTLPRESAFIQGVAIFLAVIINAVVTASNNYQKEKKFELLNNFAQQIKLVEVIRSNEIININPKELVTGDILVIREGMEIQVDGWTIESNEIYADQSNITGQIEPVAKLHFSQSQRLMVLNRQQMIQKQVNQVEQQNQHIPSPVILSGTKIVSGEGKMICLVVGRNSCLGKIIQLSKQKTNQTTPLQAKLEVLSQKIGNFGLASALLIFIVLLLRFTADKIANKKIDLDDARDILNYFTLAITVVVVAIPEGLPLSVTLTLAYSVKKMLLDNNLVRKLQACETMGEASQICSDKTGTLTMNKMSVVKWWNQTSKQITPYIQLPLIYPDIHNDFIDLLLASIFVNSSSELRPLPTGSATELALMRFGQRLGKKYQFYRYSYKIIFKIPFSSSRKRMSIVIEIQNKKRLLIKGAAEIILSCCTKRLRSTTNQVEKIDESSKSILKNIIYKMAQQGLRVIAVSDIQKKKSSGLYDVEQNNLTLLAIFGIRDPPRQQVTQSIKQCKRAGIKVRMLTGDNLLTAISVAKQIGIITPNSICLQGPQFQRITGGIVCSLCWTQKCDCQTSSTNIDSQKPRRKDVIKNEEQFDRIISNLDVLARSRPEDKYALVTGLINKGYVVAVTGDGTDDAPALRKADIGFAMGRSGTDIARLASSIILVDDNFNSIVKAVMWGRNIYDSIKKFIQFQLTVNIVSVIITLIGAAVLQQTILQPIQLLWVNLIMDTMASMALVTDSPNQQLLDRKPHTRDQDIITKKMKKQIFFQVLYQIFVIFILIFYGQKFIPQYPDQYDQILGTNLGFKYYQGVVQGGTVVSGRNYSFNGKIAQYAKIYNKTKVHSRHFTVIFNTFVFMQIFNFLNSRKLYDEINIFYRISQNKTFIFVVSSMAIIQVLIVTFGSLVFGVYYYYGLNFVQWIICIIFGMGTLPVSLIAKFVSEDFLFEQEQESTQNLKRFSSLIVKNSGEKRNMNRAFFIPSKSE